MYTKHITYKTGIFLKQDTKYLDMRNWNNFNLSKTTCNTSENVFQNEVKCEHDLKHLTSVINDDMNESQYAFGNGIQKMPKYSNQ